MSLFTQGPHPEILDEFDTIAEASAYHLAPTVAHVAAAFAEYRADRATWDENCGLTETDRYDAIQRRDPKVWRR